MDWQVHRRHFGCFRPLAGFWFLNSTKCIAILPIEGFRPLAGFWFLNMKDRREANLKWGFRPLAGFWFLNQLNKAANAAVEHASPPCGVLVLKLRKRK